MKKREVYIKKIEKILEDCTNCGYCKSSCPIFRVLRTEGLSARGRANQLVEKVILEESIFCCSGCRACENVCPNGVKLYDAIIEARKILALGGKQTKSNKQMLKKVKKYGNPFGKMGDDIPDKFYCC